MNTQAIETVDQAINVCKQGEKILQWLGDGRATYLHFLGNKFLAFHYIYNEFGEPKFIGIEHWSENVARFALTARFSI